MQDPTVLKGAFSRGSLFDGLWPWLLIKGAWKIRQFGVNPLKRLIAFKGWYFNEFNWQL